MSYLTKEALLSMPKKTPNAYQIFRTDHFEDLKSKNADKTMIDITKIISQMWNDLDDKRKNEYNQRHEKAKEDQPKEYQAWLKLHKLDEDKTEKFLKDQKVQRALKKKTKKSKSEDDEPPKMVQKKGKGKNAKASDDDDEPNSDSDQDAKQKQKQKEQPKGKEQSKQQPKAKDHPKEKEHPKQEQKEQPKEVTKPQPAARRKSQGKKGN